MRKRSRKREFSQFFSPYTFPFPSRRKMERFTDGHVTDKQGCVRIDEGSDLGTPTISQTQCNEEAYDTRAEE